MPSRTVQQPKGNAKSPKLKENGGSIFDMPIERGSDERAQKGSTSKKVKGIKTENAYRSVNDGPATDRSYMNNSTIFARLYQDSVAQNSKKQMVRYSE